MITGCACYGNPCAIKLTDGGITGAKDLFGPAPLCLDCTKPLADGGLTGLDPGHFEECNGFPPPVLDAGDDAGVDGGTDGGP